MVTRCGIPVSKTVSSSGGNFVHSSPNFCKRRTQCVKTHKSHNYCVWFPAHLCASIDQEQCIPWQHYQCWSDQTVFSSHSLCYCCAHFGRLELFDCSSADLDFYFERLRAFYRANNANVYVFLSVVGSKTYNSTINLRRLVPLKIKLMCYLYY